MKKIYWFLAVLLIGCSGNKTNPLPDQIDEMFSQEFKGNEPGAAVLVIMNRDTVFKKGYGVADISTKENSAHRASNLDIGFPILAAASHAMMRYADFLRERDNSHR